MPDLLTPGEIWLEPGASKVRRAFRFAPESAPGANDGSLPYGQTVASAALTALSEAGTDVTSKLVETGSVQVQPDGLTVGFALNYSSDVAAGTYLLRLLATLANGTVEAFEARRLRVGPRGYAP